MEKVVLPLWRAPDTDADELDSWAHTVIPYLHDAREVLGARVLVEAPEGAAMRYGAPVNGSVFGGLVSLWLASYQDLGAVASVLDDAPISKYDGYLVSESVVLGYPAHMAITPGERSPGLCQATLFDKNPAASDDEFFHTWHTLHRKTTLDLHPVWVYVRNEVVRSVTPDAPPLRGIVYENTKTEADMLEPHKFFGSGGDDDALKRNIEHVFTETGQFINYDTIQTAVMHEYLVRRVST
ncbi:MAG: hypothetical protein QOG53_2105 [Frankiales bacterium]|jgi:hypothetical protein|nr:hypothetical protein [Frankiales bacterium]